MPRRWIIRLCLILPLLLCLAAWVRSTQHYDYIAYKRAETTTNCGWLWGSVIVGQAGDRSAVDDWRFFTKKMPFSCFMPPPESTTIIGFLGFGYKPVDAWGAWAAFLPLWFPTLVLSVLLTTVWRKTRQPQKTGSFPVEPSASSNCGR